MPNDYPGSWPAQLSPHRFAHLHAPGGPRVSPDGRWIAFLRDHNGRADIWIVLREGGVPTQVTAEHSAPGGGPYGAAGGYCWSPDSRRIAYTTPDGGHLWSIAIDGSDDRELTNIAGSQQQPDWSERGIVLINARPNDDLVDVALIPGDGADWPRRLAPSDRFYIDPHWSPDGRYVAVTSFPKPEYLIYEAYLTVIDVETGQIHDLASGHKISNRGGHFAPDSRRIAYVSDQSGWANLWLTDVESGQSHQLVPEEREQADPVWSPDGRQIAYLRNDDGNVQVYLLEVESGQTRPLTHETGTHMALDWTPDGKEIICAFQSPVVSPRIIGIDVAGGERRDIVTIGLAGIDAAGLVMPESIHYQSVDGLNIHAMLYQPPEVKPVEHPLLVHIHGGPQGQYGYRWDATVQYWVQRGWVVVEPNFRGSTGYGRAHLDGLNGTWGDLDLEDNVASIDAVDKLGLIDRKRSVAWGGSGGGYATMICMTRKPDVFKAGVALYGLSNLVSFGEQTDRLARDLVPWILGPSRENFDTWVARSPITYAEQVKSPMLILQGDADWRVPPAQSEELVHALEKLGQTVEYKLYSGEGHGWRRADTIIDYMERMDRFLTKYVVER
ncbi:MAG TPA: S9 family peptidase [Thermomicrobiaceae bacterium]|nr:S9 family peptidase [Thermomicrobiaceae bacterium]